MIRRAAALLFVLLMVTACSSAPSGGNDDTDADQLFAVVVHAMGVSGNSANFEVSIANVSSETFKVRGVTVNPGVPREMSGIPVTSEFTLEPGMERSVTAEMRRYPGTTATQPEWPDVVAVEISFERHGKSEGRTYRVDVLGIRQR